MEIYLGLFPETPYTNRISPGLVATGYSVTCMQDTVCVCVCVCKALSVCVGVSGLCLMRSEEDMQGICWQGSPERFVNVWGTR